jgi:hypothetical protein
MGTAEILRANPRLRGRAMTISGMCILLMVAAVAIGWPLADYIGSRR